MPRSARTRSRTSLRRSSSLDNAVLMGQCKSPPIAMGGLLGSAPFGGRDHDVNRVAGRQADAFGPRQGRPDARFALGIDGSIAQDNVGRERTIRLRLVWNRPDQHAAI